MTLIELGSWAGGALREIGRVVLARMAYVRIRRARLSARRFRSGLPVTALTVEIDAGAMTFFNEAESYADLAIGERAQRAVRVIKSN